MFLPVVTLDQSGIALTELIKLSIIVKTLIIHEENTKEVMSVKEFVYLIQNHTDLHEL
jgi:hypothetical protein